MALAADPNDTYSLVNQGKAKSVLAISDWIFAVGDFPVQEGESLLVLGDAGGTAMLYFDDTLR